MSSMSSIPFNRPAFIGAEREHIEEALALGQISADGEFTRRCHAMLESIVGCNSALLTTSCTDALELSALLVDVGPGDEVVVPTYTFVSTANAFALRGARPRFVDSREDDFNLDPRAIETALTARTRAICVVHYAGIACDMDAILAIAARVGIPVIEDNAHGLFGTYRSRPLGSFGALATLSFHETKNITCGEGGALCVNDPALAERAEILRSKGTNRARFLRGEVDKYTWVDIGSSYGLSDLSAAVLCAQLSSRDEIQSRRRRLWTRYASLLEEIGRKYPMILPSIASDRESAFHMYQVRFPSLGERDAFLVHARRHGVHAVFHYIPLHRSDMGERFGYRRGEFPVAERLSETVARLPFFTTMTDAEQDRVVEVVASFVRERAGA